MAAIEGKDIKTLLLVGRSGNGKSSIGNVILGQKKFSTKQKNETKAAYETGVCNNHKFKVIDCSGIGDTGEDLTCSTKDVFNTAQEAVIEGDETGGIQAVVFVLKYGVRYTEQEKKAVLRVREIFGDDVFKNWVVLAFSYGDNFEYDTEETFDDWCRSRTGDIKNLFEEVSYRCVLFNKIAQPSHEKSKTLLEVFIKEIQSIQKETLWVLSAETRSYSSSCNFFRCCFYPNAVHSTS